MLLQQGLEKNGGAVAVFGILLRELALDRIEVGACLLDADTWPETSENVQFVIVPPRSQRELAFCIAGICRPENRPAAGLDSETPRA